MLTKGDEYPIHQTPEPVAVAGSDRNFYDRFFFNGYSRDGSIFFAGALGVYPHLNIMDGAISVLKDGRQRSLHVSRIFGMERMDTRVGPLSVEILAPLQSVRLHLQVTEGLGLDVRFEGRHFPIEEPRFTYRQGPRMLIDCTRMTQNGSWTGSLSVDGEHLDIVEFYGTRDRSWGVRPIGARDAQPVVPLQMPQYYWLWAPVNLPGASHFFHVNEDACGAPWNTRSVLAPEGAMQEGLSHLHRPEFSVDWTPGTRRIGSARLKAGDPSGGEHLLTYTPMAVFQMKGIGYGHATWGHGAFHGGYAQEREDFVPAELAWNDLDNLHIQALVQVMHIGPDGSEAQGLGVLEQLCLGPHGPSGWTDIVDA